MLRHRIRQQHLARLLHVQRERAHLHDHFQLDGRQVRRLRRRRLDATSQRQSPDRRRLHQQHHPHRHELGNLHPVHQHLDHRRQHHQPALGFRLRDRRAAASKSDRPFCVPTAQYSPPAPATALAGHTAIYNTTNGTWSAGPDFAEQPGGQRCSRRARNQRQRHRGSQPLRRHLLGAVEVLRVERHDADRDQQSAERG